MTSTEVCKAILRNIARLPLGEQAALKRTYAKTWLIVELYGEMLVVPTKHGAARLRDLLAAVLLARGKGKKPAPFVPPSSAVHDDQGSNP